MKSRQDDALLWKLDARQQIHDALMRYCRGVDRLDRELILSAYHPGARDNHGSFDGTCEDFVDWVFSYHGEILSCTHFVGNVLIQFDSDAANCESYVMAFHRRMVDGALHDLMGCGRYIDRFEERGGDWRIVDRVVVFEWDRLDPVERQWDGPLTSQLVKGSRSRADASYQLMGHAIA